MKRASSAVVRCPSWLVEHYWPGLTAELFRTATRRIRRTAAAMARDGLPIRYCHSTLVPADESAFSVIEAASPAFVQELYARAGVPFDRIVTAVEM
jgi:hypothetical protein